MFFSVIKDYALALQFKRLITYVRFVVYHVCIVLHILYVRLLVVVLCKSCAIFMFGIQVERYNVIQSGSNHWNRRT